MFGITATPLPGILVELKLIAARPLDLSNYPPHLQARFDRMPASPRAALCSRCDDVVVLDAELRRQVDADRHSFIVCCLVCAVLVRIANQEAFDESPAYQPA